jgi:hypothetical protein
MRFGARIGLLFGSLVGSMVMGCSKPEEETGTIEPDTDGDVEGCGATNAPTITSFDITDDGMSEGDACGDASRPMILLNANVGDLDGDLHLWRLQVWWDQKVDGSVSTDDAPQEVQGSVGTECKAFTANLGMRLCVTGNPPFSTELEFGARVLDDADNQSALVVKSFTTPNEAGEY